MKGRIIMSFRRFAIGVGVGFIAGYLLRPRLEKEFISPELAFKIAKDEIAEKMPITGSWIHTQPETLERNQLEYTVYRAGITTSLNGESQYFDLLLDARTGTILEFQ